MRCGKVFPCHKTSLPAMVWTAVIGSEPDGPKYLHITLQEPKSRWICFCYSNGFNSGGQPFLKKFSSPEGTH